MRSGIRSLRVDRERAIRLGAIIGLVLLGASTLPGLLKTPDPPPVPANVGFRPAEMNRFAAQPGPGEAIRKEAAKKMRERTLKRKQLEAGRKRRARKREESRRRRASKRNRKHHRGGDEPAAGPASDSGPTSTISPSPAPAASPSPAPVYSPPASVPPPPPPSPAPTPQPADGSQEFAPR